MGLFDLLKKKVSEVYSPVISEETPKPNNLTTVAIQSEEIPTLENRISKAFPSKNGLFPHEILMLSYASSFKVGNNSFQNFWKYDYSVNNPQDILNYLFEKGFICRGNASSSLKHIKVTELKELLNKIGEKSTGKKDDLIQRILEKYDSSELETLFPDRNYMLTELGEEELSQNEYVIYLHRHKYVSIWEMNILLHTDNPSNLGYRDIIWRELNKKSTEFYKTSDYNSYRGIRLSMHDFLIEEGKYKTALHMLIEAMSYDLRGTGGEELLGTNNEEIQKVILQSKMTNFFSSDDKKEVVIPPGLINYFNNLYKELNMSSEEFIKLVYQYFSEISIQNRVFSNNECANIALSEIGLEERKITDTYAIAEQRIKKNLNMV